MFDASIIQAIRNHAIAEYPNESCGVVTPDGYMPCKNIHPEPLRNFKISGSIIAPLLSQGKLLAIVHSHPNGPFHPSKLDMQAQIDFGIPFGLTITDGENASKPMWWGGNAPIQPLVGREFVHGITDCYALVRDYYKTVLNIQLNDYARADVWWSKGDNTENMYLDYFDKEGFAKVDSLKPHDLIFMTIASKVVNHAAVYLGGDRILHHFANRLSNDEDTVGKWHKQIHGFYRHKSLIKGDE